MRNSLWILFLATIKHRKHFFRISSCLNKYFMLWEENLGILKCWRSPHFKSAIFKTHHIWDKMLNVRNVSEFSSEFTLFFLRANTHSYSRTCRFKSILCKMWMLEQCSHKDWLQKSNTCGWLVFILQGQTSGPVSLSLLTSVSQKCTVIEPGRGMIILNNRPVLYVEGREEPG